MDGLPLNEYEAIQIIEIINAAVIDADRADQRFWSQLRGSIDYGFSYTSGNSSYQTQLSASAAYNGEGYLVTTDISSVFNTQAEGTARDATP